MPDDTLDDLRQTIADLHRELAHCRAELDEALEQQTATAEVLQVINSSPGDLAPVFDAMLEKALRLCSAAFGCLWIRDGEVIRAAAIRGATPDFAEFLEREIVPVDADMLVARAVRERAMIHVADVVASEPYRRGVPLAVVSADQAGIRTILMMPMAKENTGLGLFTIYRQEVRPFSDKEIALVENFAAQAVIAMENARLITETREALEQQTATAEVLQVINSSPGDLAPVFDAMLEKAIHLCDAAFGTLWTRDGESFRAVALRRVPAEFADLLAKAPYRPEPGSGHERLMRGELFVQVEDAAAEARIGPVRQALVERGGARSLVAVPLRKDGSILGVISAYRQEVRPFTDKQIALLQNFAAQAVIAMENARLLGELQQRTGDLQESLEYQTATSDVLKVISRSAFDLQPVLDTLVETAAKLCDCPGSTLAIRQGDAYRYVATFSLNREWDAKLREMSFAPGRNTLVGRVALEGRIVHIADAAADPEYALPELVTIGHIRTMLGVPLLREGVVIGALGVHREHVQPFSERQIDLVRTFADQAVIAIENTRLITETQEALEQQTATAEVLQVINSSPGNLAPVFDAMLEKALRQCEAAFGILHSFAGDRFHCVASRGVSVELAEALRQPLIPIPGSLSERIVRGERTICSTNLLEGESYRVGAKAVRAMVDLGGARTSVVVALRKDDQLLGSISAYRQEVRPFTEKQIALLENFGAQAVIAIENARLLGELRERTDEVAGWNRELEARVAAQLAEIERTGKLRRFLAPQLADLIVAQGDESILESHRREIVVVFCDLRGFTGFAERAEPEEVMALLRDYHAAMGPIVASFEGTLDHYAGDGIMVFFNDPLPTPDPARRAIDMAVAMRAAAQGLLRNWRRHGHDIGFGVGISQGYATLGQIGFAERMDYTAIGTVTNLAARLCGEAKDGQILVSRRVAIAVEDSAMLEEIGDLSLKGLSQAVAVYNVPQ
jgi:GAF domain-containing protein